MVRVFKDYLVVVTASSRFLAGSGAFFYAIRQQQDQPPTHRPNLTDRNSRMDICSGIATSIQLSANAPQTEVRHCTEPALVVKGQCLTNRKKTCVSGRYPLSCFFFFCRCPAPPLRGLGEVPLTHQCRSSGPGV